ncbi:unnamed protein product, partial [Phaeothamnion confervicola]
MNNVVQISNARDATRGAPRHWVRLGSDQPGTDAQRGECGALAIGPPNASGRLFATLTLTDRHLTEELTRSGEFFIHICDIKLMVSVRAVEGTRVLVEFGMP